MLAQQRQLAFELLCQFAEINGLLELCVKLCHHHVDHAPVERESQVGVLCDAQLITKRSVGRVHRSVSIDQRGLAQRMSP